ncbi:hypothetical protein EE612_054029 [Oryza sativa]|nr:hypothetical protein EE612_054029 [Oryza sativa]
MATGGNSLPSPSCADDKKRRVCYYYDPGIAHIKFSDDHVMVPARVAMAHSLVGVYGMLGDMRRLRTRPATEAEIRRFHSPEYVDLLRDLTPESYANDAALRQKAEGDHGIGGDDDCPAFDRLWKYCRGYAGGSLAAARALVDGASDIAINWSGGMHHASACKATGFCMLRQRHRARHQRAPRHLQPSHLRRHRRAPRRRRAGCLLGLQPGHDAVVPPVRQNHAPQELLPGLRRRQRNRRRRRQALQRERAAGRRRPRRRVPHAVRADRGQGHGGVPAGGHRAAVRRRLALRRPPRRHGAVGAGPRGVRRLPPRVQPAAAPRRRRRLHHQPRRLRVVLRDGGRRRQGGGAPRRHRDTQPRLRAHVQEPGNKLHYQKSTATAARKRSSSTEVTKGKVLEHLSQVKRAPSVQFRERHGGDNAAGVELYYDRPPSLEDDEPAQRLHRLCFPGLTKRIRLND